MSVWFHQPQAVVQAYGPSVPVARRFARAADAPYRTLVWPPGSAARWQNGRGERSFVVELGPGRVRPRAVTRYVRALGALAR